MVRVLEYFVRSKSAYNFHVFLFVDTNSTHCGIIPHLSKRLQSSKAHGMKRLCLMSLFGILISIYWLEGLTQLYVNPKEKNSYETSRRSFLFNVCDSSSILVCKFIKHAQDIKSAAFKITILVNFEFVE